MARANYRHTIRILRAKTAKGGYEAEEYDEVAVTSAAVRDESESEYMAAEAARVAHVRVFTTRARDVREDDVIVWHGMRHKVERIDRYDHRAREMRVRASWTDSRYGVEGVSADGDAAGDGA